METGDHFMEGGLRGIFPWSHVRDSLLKKQCRFRSTDYFNQKRLEKKVMESK